MASSCPASFSSLAALFGVILAATWHVQPAHAQPPASCLLLSSSEACPAFRQYYVDVSALGSRYPFLANVTDVSSFDKSVSSYAQSGAYYTTHLGCSGSDNVPYARYSLSRLCAELIQTDVSLGCNYQHNVAPPPLCQSTCNTWVHNVINITSDTSICADTTTRTDALTMLSAECANWPGLSGNATSNCVAGSANEPDNCGFQADVDSACQYCAGNSTDACCSSVSCSSGLGVGAIIGIVAGSVVGAVMLCFAVGCFCLRRKRVRKDTYGFKTYISSSRDDYHNNVDRAETGSRHALVSHHDDCAPSDTTPTPSAIHLQEPPPPPLAPPPALATAPAPSTAPQQPRPEDLYIVVHPYPPQMEDELGLQVDDLICLAAKFDDGWALGINAMTGQKGVFPLLCVAPLPPELLNEIIPASEAAPPAPAGPAAALYDPDSSKILLEDDITQQQLWQPAAPPAASIPPPPPHTSASSSAKTATPPPKINLITVDRIRENVRRSISLGSFPHGKLPRPTAPATAFAPHGGIPKRTASMRAPHHYGYSEAESPTSPTLNTPFFDVTPELNGSTPMHDQDAYELHDHRRRRRSSSSSNSSSMWIKRPNGK